MMFGGTGVPFGETASNELHLLDLRTLHWRNIECTGEPPTKGYGQVRPINTDEEGWLFSHHGKIFRNKFNVNV